MKLDGRKLFKNIILVGLGFIIFGFVLNVIVAIAQPEDGFSFLGAWFSFAGVLIIVFSLIYACIRWSISQIFKNVKK